VTWILAYRTTGVNRAALLAAAKTQLGMIEAYLLLGRTNEAQAERRALLARKDVSYISTAVPIARFRGMR
jgi:hypothetical protein